MPRPKYKPGTERKTSPIEEQESVKALQERKTLSIEDQKSIKALQESIIVLEKIIDEIYKK